jgi:AraC-like DNA-binding protein
VHTTDVTEATEILTHVYLPTRITPVGKGRLSLRMNAMQLPGLTAGHVHFGTDVVANAPHVDSYFVNVPLSGWTVNRWADGHTETTRVGAAAVFSPGTPAGITWSGDCGQLCIKVSEKEMQRQLEALLNRQAGNPVVFARRLDLTSPKASNWFRLLRILEDEAGRGEGILSHRLAVENLQQLLIQGMLLIQPHNYAEALSEEAPAAGGKVVKHAVDLMHADTGKAWDTSILALETGVSARALQRSFQQCGLPPPMTYLRRLRLHRVRAELMRGCAGTVSVTAVASRWGFLHMGRFSEQYRELFGQPPSETLRVAGESRHATL